MKNQKIAIATVIATVLIFGMDFLFYKVLLGGSSGECCMKEMPDFMWMIIGDLLFALAFVVIYDKIPSAASKVMSGINYGIWIAILASVAMNFVWYSVMEMELQSVLMESVYGLVKFSILGVVVALLVTDDGGDRGKATGGGERGMASEGGDRGKATGGGE